MHRCMIKQNSGSVLESYSVKYNMLFIILEYRKIKFEMCFPKCMLIKNI